MKKYHFRHDNIILMGDTHGIASAAKLLLKDVPNGTDVFHLGDFGLGFNSRDIDLRELIDLNQICEKRDIKFYVIRGNHDNPTWWDGSTQFKNVKLVEDYSTMVFPNGSKALAVGGAISIDRYDRTYLLNYWDNEVTQKPPKFLGEYDFVFAHDAPSFFNNSTEGLRKDYPGYIDRDRLLIKDCNAQRSIMDEIARLTECRLWFSGHFHNNEIAESSGIRYRCVNINELLGFDAGRQ